MDLSSLGIATVAAITVICYLVGLVVKASPWNNDKFIPIALRGDRRRAWDFSSLYGAAEFPGNRPVDGCLRGNYFRTGSNRNQPDL